MKSIIKGQKINMVKSGAKIVKSDCENQNRIRHDNNSKVNYFINFV